MLEKVCEGQKALDFIGENAVLLADTHLLRNVKS